jgi:hypothetical protein
MPGHRHRISSAVVHLYFRVEWSRGGRVEFLLAVRDPMDAYPARDQFAARKIVNRLHAVHDARTAIVAGVPGLGLAMLRNR